MTSLITFACYGSHLPGRFEGIVNRKENRRGDPYGDRLKALALRSEQSMTDAPYSLDLRRSQEVLMAMVGICEFRGWHVYAMHVRSTHVHAVVYAHNVPERVMIDLKAYASRRLNELGLDSPGVKRWARHGSTRYLNDDESLAAAIRYVRFEQGLPMAVYPAPPLD